MTMTKEQLQKEYDSRLDEYEKEFRKKARLTEDEPITEDKMTRYREHVLVDVAMRKAVHSSVLREHILSKYR